MEISAIIVSYNTREMTLRCLRALDTALKGLRFEVLLVDNASKDGSADAVRAAFPSVKVIESQRNAGFGAANNEAMRVAAGDYFLLVNSDAFVEAEAIAKMLEFIRSHPNVSVIGPTLVNEDGSPQDSCFRFPSPTYAWMENLWLSTGYKYHQRDEIRHVDFVIGACMLVKKAVYEKVGGFDEQFFMYCEEADWQRRMQERGGEVVYLPTVSIPHVSGASDTRKAAISEDFFKSLDRYILKHHGFVGLISFRLAMVIGCTMRAVIWSLLSLLRKFRAQALTSRRRHLALVRRQAMLWSCNRVHKSTEPSLP